MALLCSVLTHSRWQSMCFSLVVRAEPITQPRQKTLAASMSISSVKGQGKVIPISSTTHDSPMMLIVAFHTQNMSTAAELISACDSPMSGVTNAMDDALDSNITGALLSLMMSPFWDRLRF